MCTEASYLSTGFSTYAHEVLKRLHATGRYDLAEYATYGDTSDPHDRRWEDVPWAFLPAVPDRNSPQEVAEYQSKVTNQFGEWKWESVCLDFLPDIVVTFRDHWMDEHVGRSPFRPFYHWCWMPTIDAYPQADEWVASYVQADAVFAYSAWGLDILKGQGGGLVNAVGTAPPGADFETFRPVPDRAAHKKALGLPEDSLVVGTCMRNQRRKLYPDLVQAFALFLRSAPLELARRAYLYLHVCYPDVGWEIPSLVKESGIGARTLFTYQCDACGVAFPSFYQDARAYCRACGRHRAMLPNSHKGVSRSVLARVYNFMDIYVQMASSEGFGMPMVEAAACGVPVFAVDYSAMSDVVRKLKGLPLKVLALSREAETGCYRAVPDNGDLVEKLIHFLSLPGGVRLKRGMDAREGAKVHYDYDRTAKVWADHFDSIEVRPQGERWGSPPRLHAPPTSSPAGPLTDLEWARWGITNIAGRPDLAGGRLPLRMARDLSWGSSVGDTPKSVFNEMALLGQQVRPSPYTREHAVAELLAMCRHRNLWEQRRAERFGTPHEQ